MGISTRAEAIRPTQIREFRAKARAESLDLGIGQPDLEVPEPVRRAARRAIDEGRAPYSDNLGLPETRRAVAEHYGVEPEQTMITCGVQEALAVALFGLVEPGDEVLVPDPGFPAYPNLVRAAGGTPVPYTLDREDAFALDTARVKALVSEDTSAIVLNSPSNPTGAIHRKEPLRETLAFLADRDVAWISDEIYEDYVYGEHERTSPLGLPEAGPGLRLGALSKSMHVMGWRVGWALGPKSWIRRLKPLHQHLVTCAPTPAQRATVAALSDFDELFEPTLRKFARRRRLALEATSRLPGVTAVPPRGAFYLFLDVRRYTGDSVDTLTLAESILTQQDVVVVPGSGFGAGGEGFLRLAYTVDRTTLDEAFDRLSDFFEGRAT